MKYPDMRKSTLFFFFIFVLGISNLYSQDWDYQKYPKLDISLQHLNADLHVDEVGSIEGDVLYRATVNADDPDSLVFDASRMDILSVSVNDAEREFSAANDQLVIYLNEVFAEEAVLNIRIQYEANPKYGVLRDVNRTTWTSQLPKTTRHWIPVIDHPRVQFTTEILVTHPSGQTLVANGRQVRSEVMSVDEERTTYESDTPIPATALGWALGEFSEHSSTTLNRNRRNGNQSPIQIRVYSESNLTSDTNFAELASNTLESVRDKIGAPYPYQDLKIVVLDNDFWETKSYAAGLVFVYRDHGDFQQQIQRGILSQWIGTQIREEQWSDAGAIHSAHAIIANQMFEFDPVMESAEQPYNVFSLHSYSKWANFFEENQLPRFKSSVQSSINNILNNGRSILGWNELAQIIYNESGQPFFEGFEPEELDIAEESSIEYTAELEWDEVDNTVQVNFEAVGQMVDELVTVNVEEITFQGTNEHEVTFTGQSESSVISVSSGIENLKLNIANREDIQLNVEKPFMFWIYQLRNDTDPEQRAEAARGLANFTDNPDLQLALDDILQVESNPEVYAEIVRSLSVLTAGASGMGERFLGYASSQQHLEVRIAAVEALGSFPNNEQVVSRLQSIALQPQSPELQRTAIQSLADVTDAERFNTIAGNLVSREPVLDQVPTLLQLLAEKGETESAVDMASTFIAEQFPYDVRKAALDIMLEYDRSSANWEERLPDLFADIHPGIRFSAAQALEFVSAGSRAELAEEFLMEEYDERVRRVLAEY